ncbi:hypothetical protein SAMN02799643_05781 [Methylobacterium sp. UNCCL125]|jgi:hypothetical protein|nr:hypothetical protein SAMN02799643_05781 [Methylobacterium sp. UNCCL125]
MAHSNEEGARAASVITPPEAVAALRAAVAAAGSQKRFACAHGLSQSDVSSALRGRRPPAPGILDALGISWALVRRGGQA